MPTLAVAKDYLFQLLEHQFTKQQFEDLCFEFGIELDDVTSEREMYRREHEAQATTKKAKDELSKKLATLSGVEMYKIDTPANRYDLLCAEGMAIALKVFRGWMPAPQFKMLPPQLTMTVKKSTRNIRDFVVCAVLRNLTFNEQSYRSFIDFQDKLHSGLARKRVLASVGTHDLDKFKGPNLTYACLPKNEISFTPLNQTQTLNCAGDGLAKFYAADRHISKFIPYIAEFPTYPVILDQDGTILSLPPIINSDKSKIDVNTRNMFIECTAPDLHKATVLVEQLVCAFSMYCERPFEVERVKVVYEDPTALRETLKLKDAGRRLGHWTNTEDEIKLDLQASEDITPDMYHKKVQVCAEDASRRIGINVDAKKAAELLSRMQLHAVALDPEGKTSDKKSLVSVQIPPCRSDVLHPCDVIEDVAIAYGYDNIVYQETPTRSNGFQQPLNKLTHLLRAEAAAAGYTEMLTFSLCSRDEAFASLGRKDTDVAVHIANPQTIEFQICRPSLLPGTLKVFQANKSQPLPQKFFECSDIVRLEPTDRTGCQNERHFGALMAHPVSSDSTGYEDIQGLAEQMLGKLGLHKKQHFEKFEELVAAGIKGAYSIAVDEGENADNAFFPGRRVKLLLHDLSKPEEAAKNNFAGVRFGGYGVLHPLVLKNVEMQVPASYVEFDITNLLPYSA